MSPRRVVLKYYEIFRVSLRTSWAYIYDQLFSSAFLVVVMFVFLQLWRTTYTVTKSQAISGFTLADMLWYLAVAESLTMAVPQVCTRIDREVRTGDIAYRLNKPMNYAGYYMATFWAEFVPRLGVNLFVSGVVVWAAVGPPPISAPSVIAFSIAVLCGQTLNFLVAFSIGLAAFWIEDTAPVYLLYTRLVMLLGGTLLPLEIFPTAVRRVAELLPFRQVIYGPAKLLVGGEPTLLSAVVVGQAGWLLAALLLAGLLYATGVRRLNVQGG